MENEPQLEQGPKSSDFQLALTLEDEEGRTRAALGIPAAKSGRKVYQRPILRKIRKETGMGQASLKRAQKLHPNDPIKQIHAFFESFVIPAATGRARTVSIKTEELYVVQVRVMVADLRDLNMGIRNLGELSARHARALIQHYEAKGHSGSSLQKKATVLRRFGTWIGRPDLVPRLIDVVKDPKRSARSYSSVESKAWTAKGVCTGDVIERMRQECPVAALQMEIQCEFGLRPREVVMLKPLSADQGHMLFVTDGTKGGRARMVPIDDPRKRELIERAKEIARGNSRGILSDKPSRTLQKALTHYYYLARKVGVCRADLGVTLHGLRHEYANRLFKDLTGFDSPVNGGRVPASVAGVAMQRVSQDLGHGRKHAAAAYLGSVKNMDYHTYQSIKTLIAKLEADARLLQAVREVGPSSWWLVGNAAEGKPLQGVLRLAFEPHAGADSTLSAHAVLSVSVLVEQIVGCPASLSPRAALVGRGESWLELVGLGRASQREQPKAALIG